MAEVSEDWRLLRAVVAFDTKLDRSYFKSRADQNESKLLNITEVIQVIRITEYQIRLSSGRT
ncbi:MAG: hypothetical protein MUC48_03265 [Leptolyngbya sp. Prado105]|nr:hypothetical protein [Leptolyngbya sp. Prado105]